MKSTSLQTLFTALRGDKKDTWTCEHEEFSDSPQWYHLAVGYIQFKLSR